MVKHYYGQLLHCIDFHEKIDEKHIELIKWLLDQGVDPNHSMRSSPRNSCMCTTTMQILEGFQQYADSCYVPNKTSPPINEVSAQLKVQNEVLTLLAKHGADLESRPGWFPYLM